MGNDSTDIKRLYILIVRQPAHHPEVHLQKNGLKCDYPSIELSEDEESSQALLRLTNTLGIDMHHCSVTTRSVIKAGEIWHLINLRECHNPPPLNWIPFNCLHLHVDTSRIPRELYVEYSR